MNGYGYFADNFETAADVLEKYSQEEIIKIVFEDYPHFGKYYTSPFRNDTNANCMFESRDNGIIYFVDWADVHHPNRDCFQIIKDKFGLNFNQTIDFINQYFSDPSIKKNIQIQPKEIAAKSYKFNKQRYPITFVPRSFINEDVRFWKPFGITSQQLIEDSVKAITQFKFYANKKKSFIHILCDYNEPAYIYTEFISGHKKIYRPTRLNMGKWITDCSQNDIGNWMNLPISGKQLVITKSYKDCRVLRNMNFTAIWLQNEGQVPDEWFFRDIINRFEDVVILFDNDNTGIEAAIKLRDIFMSYGKATRIVYSMLKEKDPSDIHAAHGYKVLKQFLNESIRFGTSNMV